MRIYSLTTAGDNTHAEWVNIGPGSPVGRMFADPTVERIVIERTPDGEILKGAKRTVYERSSG